MLIDQSKLLETSSPTAPNYYKPPITIDKPSPENPIDSPRFHPSSSPYSTPPRVAVTSSTRSSRARHITKRDRKLVCAGPGNPAWKLPLFQRKRGRGSFRSLSRATDQGARVRKRRTFDESNGRFERGMPEGEEEGPKGRRAERTEQKRCIEKRRDQSGTKKLREI